MNRKPVNNATWYLNCFKGFEQRLNGGTSAPLHTVRREAADYLAATGLPTNKDESWRHSSLQQLTRVPFVPVVEPGQLHANDIEPYVVADAAAQLVFADSRFVPELSHVDNLPTGVLASNLSTMGDSAHVREHLARHAGNNASGFAALNTAFIDDGASILIPAGAEVEQPIHILYVSTRSGESSAVTFPRSLVVAADGSRASIVESFFGVQDGNATPYLTNAVCEIVQGVGSEIEHVVLQHESPDSSHVGLLYVTEAEGSRFTSTSAALAGRFTRRDVITVLAGEGVESTLNGIYLGTDGEHIDNFTTIEHAQPNCSSHELYKGVLGGASTGVFRGKIHVHQIAQNTDAYQSNQNLLLSDDAGITSQPQLEIYADDVRCSHGSTTGQLDEDALFYLQARAIPHKEAVRVLTRAFCGEVVNRVGTESVRQRIRTLAEAKVDRMISLGT